MTRVIRAAPVAPPDDADTLARAREILAHWAQHPVDFFCQAIGVQPEPWQCDVADALLVEDNIAVRACHSVGKTALLAWLTLWFIATRPFCKIPTTAPTFNKQVKDILWAEIHKWMRSATPRAPWLFRQFTLLGTRMQHLDYPSEWFAVGIASNKPINVEGYHAAHLLAIFDEAKGIERPTWEAIHGMRTTQEAKLIAASTPGGAGGEFYRVFTRYRQTWRACFVIHPEPLRATLQRPEAAHHSLGGTYYSSRVRPEWVTERRLEWGEDSAVYTARVIGDFPSAEGDALIPYAWLSAAESRDLGVAGPTWVACDVARYGRDRTVALVGRGGTLLHGETVGRVLSETTIPIAEYGGVGPDRARPLYRAIDATAALCQRLRAAYDADGIIVDDTGLGGGVSDLLRRAGERVIMANFGAPPTDRPRDPEARRLRQQRGQPESYFRTLKAQMAFALRSGFELGNLALGNLSAHILEPLIAQTSLVRTRMNARGQQDIIDPDDLDEDARRGYLVEDEGRRSPDHFHALLLLWWVTGTSALLQARGQAVLSRRGTPILGPSSIQHVVERRPVSAAAGQAAHLNGLYRRARY